MICPWVGANAYFATPKMTQLNRTLDKRSSVLNTEYLNTLLL